MAALRRSATGAARLLQPLAITNLIRNESGPAKFNRCEAASAGIRTRWFGTGERASWQAGGRGGTELERVCIVGSGNFGSAMATIIGRNAARLPSVETRVNMWVHDEDVEIDTQIYHQKLSEYINEKHENPLYLPGHPLPDNVRAVPDVAKACDGATLLVFVMPHEYLSGLMGSIRKALHPTCRGVSLIKSLDFDPVNKSPIRVSESIERAIGPDFQCGVMMGANVANEVAAGQLCESTLATRFEATVAESTQQIFHSEETFRVRHIDDVAGTEACGALKNVFALGSGFVDGLGLGGNTKAALLRVGLHEMTMFCKMFFEGVKDETFSESCGVADLITTCYGGRNRRCAEAFALRHHGKGITEGQCLELWNDIESELLLGQKLQGTHTTKDAYAAIKSRGALDDFPLISTIYNIAFKGQAVDSVVDGIRVNA